MVEGEMLLMGLTIILDISLRRQWPLPLFVFRQSLCGAIAGYRRIISLMI